jgi:hypothetical protein
MTVDLRSSVSDKIQMIDVLKTDFEDIKRAKEIAAG